MPLIHLVRHRQLKFLGHILRMSKEEPARRYALYIPTIGKRRPGWPCTSYHNYVQRLLGDNEGAMQEQQIAAFADDRRAWRNLAVACSAANGWWWWWWWWCKYISVVDIPTQILLTILLFIDCSKMAWIRINTRNHTKKAKKSIGGQNTCMYVCEINGEGIFVTFPWWLKYVKSRSKIALFSNERHFEIWFPKKNYIFLK